MEAQENQAACVPSRSCDQSLGVSHKPKCVAFTRSASRGRRRRGSGCGKPPPSTSAALPLPGRLAALMRRVRMRRRRSSSTRAGASKGAPKQPDSAARSPLCRSIAPSRCAATRRSGGPRRARRRRSSAAHECPRSNPPTNARVTHHPALHQVQRKREEDATTPSIRGPLTDTIGKFEKMPDCQSHSRDDRPLRFTTHEGP